MTGALSAHRTRLAAGGLALAGLFALALVIAGNSLASTPATTTQGVTPTLLTDGPGSSGNITSCAPLSAGNPVDGDEDPESPDPPANVSISIDGGSGSIDVTYNEDKSLDFEASAGYLVVDVFVKGGTGTNWYAYDPGVASDTGLFAPLNNGGQRAGVSHAVFCWMPDEQVVSEWCSPGFWKNNADKHGASAWPVPTNTLYKSVISSPVPLNGHNPTLLQVLQAPKTYFGATNQGAAFNAVGTYLSIAAGLTNVVEGTDNCPINQKGERS